MAVETGKVTAEELLGMPDDGFRYELVRGELRQIPPAGSEHGQVTLEVGRALSDHVRASDLGAVFAAGTGFRIISDPDTIRAPDAAFVRKERVDQLGRIKGYSPGAPDLAVEVVSPSDTYREVIDKVYDWMDAGARMVLVVDPDRRVVTAYRSRKAVEVLTEEDVVDGGDVVPGWRMPVRDIFG